MPKLLQLWGFAMEVVMSRNYVAFLNEHEIASPRHQYRLPPFPHPKEVSWMLVHQYQALPLAIGFKNGLLLDIRVKAARRFFKPWSPPHHASSYPRKSSFAIRKHGESLHAKDYSDRDKHDYINATVNKNFDPASAA
jgi:hypothetical protein